MRATLLASAIVVAAGLTTTVVPVLAGPNMELMLTEQLTSPLTAVRAAAAQRTPQPNPAGGPECGRCFGSDVSWIPCRICGFLHCPWSWGCHCWVLESLV